MLNRIYIIVGLLAILVLAGAFIAPRFIQWSDYRERMEVLASNVLGAEVTIRGDIDFTLLPQPRLHFTDVVVGDIEGPAATVGSIEADFSLLDFLRDNYNLTRLVLRQPVIDFTVDESGLFGSGITPSGSGVGLAQASIEDATFRLEDVRAATRYTATNVSGDLKLSSFAGPFQFQGSGDYSGERYTVRFSSAQVAADGSSRMTASVRPANSAYSLGVDGSLSVGMAPKFDGVLTYRQSPPATQDAAQVRGDLVLESKIVASTDRIVLTEYTLQPDENRAGTRLTGAASIQLGAEANFDLAVSGGVFALPPRDANEDTSALPYELVRLLDELPAPLVPPMAGQVGIDLAEVGLRGFALRNLHVDAKTDGHEWNVEQATADLPGDTKVRAVGTLGVTDARPTFRGQLSVNSARLDALAALWRKPSDDSALVNFGATLEGRLVLGADALGLTGGHLTLDGHSHAVELRVGFGAEKRLDVVGQFDALSDRGSAAVQALLPGGGVDQAFLNSFPSGSFSLHGKAARLLGQAGTDLVAEGQWTAEAVQFTRLSAGDFGGLGIDAAMQFNGSVLAADGSGVLKAQRGGSPGLVALYDALKVPAQWRDMLASSAPAEVLFDLAKPTDDGAQVLTLNGKLATADFYARAELSKGIGAALTQPLRLNATLDSEDSAALSQQLGFGKADLFTGGNAMMVALGLSGTSADGFDANLTASMAAESVSFSGKLSSAANGEVQGTGRLDVTLDDAGGLGQLAGGQDLSLPNTIARGQLHFEGERLARLTDTVGTVSGIGFKGELSLSRTGATTAVAGTFAVDAVSAEGLAATLFGPAAMVPGSGIWPDGPIVMGATPNQTRGMVSFTAPSVTAGGVERLKDATFELNWDEQKLRLARFEAKIGGGTASLDLSVCCTGGLTDKTVSGRLSLNKVALSAIASPELSSAISGTLDGGVRIEGTGASVAEAIHALAGEGNFTIAGFTVEQLGAGVYSSVSALDDVLTMEPEALTPIIGLALGQGQFVSQSATGAFTIAGGVARLANFIVDGQGSKLAGSINLRLSDLGLDGSFAMTPVGFVDPKGLVGEDTARIITRIAGTLLKPLVTLDLDTMVAAIQVRANEIEVDRLEALRLEDEARQRAAAEERNRLIEEQRQRAAAEAAQRAAEEAAAQKAASDAEQQRILELQRQQMQLPTPPTNGPLILTLPPVNQPTIAPPN